ncbi:hypothetical protein FGL95_07160 [Nocardiaceae bacterium YC2-7]|uniref:Uncharacterized protein n=1 Tax=Antrihabitans stalactiti TaxID=2584121 RepID=A0A848K7N6_9NOCA|nr:hypothetical protein [Antrihabitans stalactiti]
MLDTLDDAFRGLTPAERVSAAREIAERFSVVLASIERGEIGASPTEVARMEGAVAVLEALGSPQIRNSVDRQCYT